MFVGVETNPLFFVGVICPGTKSLTKSSSSPSSADASRFDDRVTEGELLATRPLVVVLDRVVRGFVGVESSSAESESSRTVDASRDDFLGVSFFDGVAKDLLLRALRTDGDGVGDSSRFRFILGRRDAQKIGDSQLNAEFKYTTERNPSFHQKNQTKGNVVLII